MLMRCFVLLLLCFYSTRSLAQNVPDTTAPLLHRTYTSHQRKPVSKKPVFHKIDTVPKRADLLIGRQDSVKHDSLSSVQPINTSTVTTYNFAIAKAVDSIVYSKHPFYKFDNPIRFTTPVRKWNGMEDIFYAFIGLLIFFAITRNAFPKYLSDLFRLYFRATLKSKQLRDQLTQAPVPSLLLNILFFVSGGLFITFLLKHYQWLQQYGFWILLSYAITALLIIYLVKFAVLKLCGWIFGVTPASDAYIFIVFTNNKIVGILLLPVLLFLAFSAGITYEIALALAVTIVIGLYAYRYLIAFATMKRQVKVNFFHFLIYLAAFEIAPVLLINKLLLKYIIERA
ncbi:MAG: hypothetical protein C4330_07585 [Chitinophagaceae bacterium]